MRKRQFGSVLAGVICLTALVLGWAVWPRSNAASSQAGDFKGKVHCAGSPLAGSTVTLYAASDGKPVQLAQAKTDDDGNFTLDTEKLKNSADKVLYLVARGGTPKAGTGKGQGDAIALLALLGTKLPEKVTVNELTTVAP